MLGRRSFLSLLGIAPVAAKIAEAAPPQLAFAKDAFAQVAKRLSPILTLVDGDHQSGCSLRVSPLHERVTIGDMFIIDTVGVIRNPAKPPRIHMVFVATEEADAGSTEIRIFPAIIPPPHGMYQNVNKSPENGRIVRRYFPGMGLSI